MKTLHELCLLRDSIIENKKNDDVLDLIDLISGKINPIEFFEETFITSGMERLFDTAFKRFSGNESHGIIKLTQSMGGGKTHNMIALGVLAKHKEAREKVFKTEASHSIENIRVIGFTGRESDVPFGIWGTLAEQLGKKEDFNSYYSPLQAPGQSAWMNLLKGEPLLILLDELPPYLQAVKSKTVGDSNLAEVTTTALANLFNAINKLPNVCLVISDLSATYEEGSEYIKQSFKELEGELSRFALMLEPVSSSSDEIYSILKTRLFKKLPSDDEINLIALEYKDKLNEAKKMQLTNGIPDSLFTGIKNSYPFHPSLRDLYARFKENQGFQQTRGLIRLMRSVVIDIYQTEKSKEKFLISPFDFNLNNSDISTQITNIKPSLTNAISHDICSNGNSIAEIIDSQFKTEIAQEYSKLILISSLADIPNALLGLSFSEVVEYMVEPKKELSLLKQVIEEFTLRAWYRFEDNAGRIHFKDQKNIMAEMNSLIDSYSTEIANSELKKYLLNVFQPKVKDCFQNVLIFPGLDDINKNISLDKNLLVVLEPTKDSELSDEIKNFYDQLEYKNRIIFLCGNVNTWERLRDNIKKYKALSSLISRMKEENTPENNSQLMTARDSFDKLNLGILQATRETFISIYFPTDKGLRNSDIAMIFQGNSFDIEGQIKDLLTVKGKYVKNTDDELFITKCEDRLFTMKEMRWTEIKAKSAIFPNWQWHHPNALEALRQKMLAQGRWREEGGDHLRKGPFELENTSVEILTKTKDPNTGESILRIIPKYGDKVYFEYGENTPTTASQQVEDYNNFKTDKELIYTFLCIDSTNQRKTGDTKTWRGEILLKYRQFSSSNDSHIEIQAYPKADKIWYSTDGSDPKNSGAIYTTDFCLPEDCSLVLAIAEYKDITSKKLEIKVNKEKIKKGIEINKNASLLLRKRIETSDTKTTYDQLNYLKKVNAEIADIDLTITSVRDSNDWTNIVFSVDKRFDFEKLDKIINNLREEFLDVETSVIINFNKIYFKTGEDFEIWIRDTKQSLSDFKEENIKQD